MQPDLLPVEYSPLADRGLKRIHRWIMRDSSLERADRFIGMITARCARIALVPEQGTRRPEIHPRARQIGFERRVSILFRVDSDRIVIIDIAYGGRLLKKAR